MASAESNAVLTDQLGTLYSLGAIGSLSDSRLLECFLARDNPEESDAAFAALVERHGPMVLRVCRQALPSLHDAHDAYQATFLVLVRRARSIQARGSIAGWLFGIARRVAARARVEAARRQRHLEKLRHQHPTPDETGEGWLPGNSVANYGPLFEEIEALPERFRSVVILHYFEGLSTEAAAQRLGCPRGTVLSRLARARRRLRARLERRGVSPAAWLPAVDGASRSFLDTTVPRALIQATVRAGTCSAMAGAAMENVVSGVVVNLSQRVSRNLMLAKIRVASLAALLVAGAAAIALVAGAPAVEEPQRRPVSHTNVTAAPSPVPAASTPKVADDAARQTVEIRVRVVTASGQPVKGAQLVLSRPQLSSADIRSCEPLATTGPDGRFQVRVRRERLEQLEQLALGSLEPTCGPVVGATAPGLAIGWTRADVKSVERGELTISLDSDDVPIDGKIMDQGGRPLRGLTVRVISVVAVKPGFLQRLRANKGKIGRSMRDELLDGIPLGEHGPIAPVTTDSAGRFRLSGVGRDRLAYLFIAGESITQSEALVLTKSDPSYKPAPLRADRTGALTVLGPHFELTVAPGRVVEGTVRDAETQQPIAGAKVQLLGIGLTGATDAQGRFRIMGQPRSQPGMPNAVLVAVDDRPYIKVTKPTGDPQGLETIHVEVALARGAWVEGRVVDQTTGKPVQAIVEYCPFGDNPHLAQYAGASFLNHMIGDEPEFPTDAQGRFRAIALPGGGVLGVRTADPSYRAAGKLAPQQAARLVDLPSFRRSHYYQALLPIEVTERETLAIPEIKVARQGAR